MLSLRASCTLQFDLTAETPFIFMLRPRSGQQQWVRSESYNVSPHTPIVEFTDPFGNLCQRLVAQPGPFRVETACEVQTADHADSAPGAPFVEIPNLPDATIPFLSPSRYCESDQFNTMASEIVAGCAPGYDQCAAIAAYIRNTFTYAPEFNESALSACQVNQYSKAVCRDMAHLGIALCRALAIPSRMVVGYLAGLTPMDMHAWFEAYVGGRWYAFDPTQATLHGPRVAVAYGRDAADVAIYTQFGDPVNLIQMEVKVSTE